MDYTIIEDCILDPGSELCFTVIWGEDIYGTWTPCQCCKWWDDFCATEFTADEGDYDNLEVVDTDETFNAFLESLGLNGAAND
jgi:hypothetical protein